MMYMYKVGVESEFVYRFYSASLDRRPLLLSPLWTLFTKNYI